MIKKYIVKPNSLFNKSLILSLVEPGSLGFQLDGLSSQNEKDLFNTKKIKYVKEEIDIKSVPTQVALVYLEDDLSIKAIVLKSQSNLYYLFKKDHQKENQLNIHQKYISSNLKELTDDYEKHCKNKGKSTYEGIGDFSKIENIDYFEYLYEESIKEKIDKSSRIYKLLFNSNNYFTVDFIDLVKRGVINIVNKDRIDKKALTLDSMEKHKSNRKDCLLIDSETKDIKYFIFTYKPHFINRYYLLKNLGNDEFEFIMESISFNKILSSPELKSIKYKNGSAFAAKEFAKMRYDNFYLKYVAFEEEEEIDETIKEEIPQIDVAKVQRDLLLQEVNILLSKCISKEIIGVSYHGKVRIKERIGDMSDEDMSALAKVAYEHGKTSGHFIESNPMMFTFLQYQQNKVGSKTLRLFKDILFFFSLEAPHELVTCFPYKTNYDTYVEIHEKKNNKKKKQ